MIENKKINEISNKIAKFTYDVMKRRITRGLKELELNHNISVNLATALIVQSIGNLDAAMLGTVLHLFEEHKGRPGALSQLLTIYFEFVLNSLGKYGDEVRSNLINNIKH